MSEPQEKFRIKNYYREFLRDSLFSTLLIVIVFVLSPYIFSSSFFKPYSNSLSDFRITDGSFTSVVDQNSLLGDTSIAIVNISGLDNRQLALLLSNIGLNEPKVIGLNKILKKEGNFNDTILASVLNGINNIIVSTRLIKPDENSKFNKIERSDPFFVSGKIEGFSNLMLENDQSSTTLRQFYPAYVVNNKLCLSFAFQLSNFDDKENVKHLIEDNYEPVTINWKSYKKFFSFIDVSDLLLSSDGLEVFKNKIVLLGNFDLEHDPMANPFSLWDKYYTPLNGKKSGKFYPDKYETDIHANIISMIDQRNYLYFVPSWINYILAVIICYVTMFLYIYVKTRVDAWYELFTVIIFVIFSIILMYITNTVFHIYSIDVQLHVGIIALAISSPVFEAYYTNVKPYIDKFLKKF